jgi:adenylate cyclase
MPATVPTFSLPAAAAVPAPRRATPDVSFTAAESGSGVERPEKLPVDAGPRTVVRTFAFVDLCGSTSFLEREGPQATLEAVTAFRAVARQVAALRGVRVAKWIGDGAMLVGVDTGPVVAAAVEICARMETSPLRLRGGVAVSEALLFDGDDYLARGANFAARICDAADVGQVLADQDCSADIPDWVEVLGGRAVTVRGMGAHTVLRLGIADDVALPPLL